MAKRGADRARSEHPWIYHSHVERAEGKVGDVIRVLDRAGRFLGHAFYNPESEITLRTAIREVEEVSAKPSSAPASKEPKPTANLWR